MRECATGVRTCAGVAAGKPPSAALTGLQRRSDRSFKLAYAEFLLYLSVNLFRAERVGDRMGRLAWSLTESETDNRVRQGGLQPGLGIE